MSDPLQHAAGEKGVAAALRRSRWRAWLRALAVIVLLAVALLAALLAGLFPYGWTRSALAGGSLLLLGAAALLSVPRLFRKSVGRWWGGATELRLTAAGIPFLLAVIVLLLAALTSGNNLIYLIAASLIAALLVSGIASALNLSGMELSYRLPPELHAGDHALAQLMLTNEKRWWPSFSLTVLIAAERERGRRWWMGRRAGAPPAERRVQLNPIYFPHLPPRRSQGVTTSIQFQRRGIFPASSFALGTRFPFALVEKRRRFGLESRHAALIVFPHAAAEAEVYRCFPDLEGLFLAQETESSRPGPGQEVVRLRAHVEGDSARAIHWKTSAKTGTLQVREFGSPHGLQVEIHLALGPAYAPAAAEEIVALAAGLIDLLARRGASLAFHGRQPYERASPGGGREGARAIGPLDLKLAPASIYRLTVMEYLACLDAQAPPVGPLAAPQLNLVQLVLGGETLAAASPASPPYAGPS